MLPFFALFLFQSNPLAEKVVPSQLAHTYSIVACDPTTGEMGGAVQSHWFSVGSDVLWVEPGTGVVATQSFIRVAYGPLGLAAMARGEEPKAVITRLTAEDKGRDVRQLGMVDAQGRAAGYTGNKCIDFACNQKGASFSVQANIMLKDTVCAAMARAYQETKGPLARRLLAALEAAQAEGGDLRGRQSAAIKVVTTAKPANPWEGRILDLRVEDNPAPVVELKRLMDVHDAYAFMNKGDLHIENDRIEKGMAAYARAVSMLPQQVEPIFWQAVTLASIGREKEAMPLFKQVFQREPIWRKLPRRLVKAGLLPDDPELLQKIEAQ